MPYVTSTDIIYWLFFMIRVTIFGKRAHRSSGKLGSIKKIAPKKRAYTGYIIFRLDNCQAKMHKETICMFHYIKALPVSISFDFLTQAPTASTSSLKRTKLPPQLIRFQVQLDEPNKIYFAGDEIKGHVQVDLSESLPIQGKLSSCFQQGHLACARHSALLISSGVIQTLPVLS